VTAETRVVADLDDYARVQCVRAAVYMAEQRCPYDEEFDGNDFSATHLLATVGDEPVGCLRIRYFASFVKFERLAVLSGFRERAIASGLVEDALAFCRKKGFETFYAQAQQRLEPFWRRRGFNPIAVQRPLVFSDHDYVEMVARLAPDDGALTLQSDPYVLIRPEGRWDTPGILDRSAVRPPTRPV
jgi:predicted GNAT family N-acyltransferase